MPFDYDITVQAWKLIASYAVIIAMGVFIGRKTL